MANSTNKIFVDKMGGRPSTEYIGQPGEIFYDPAVGDLRLSDGLTVGGTALLSEQFAGVYRGFQAGVNFFRNTNDQDIAQIIIHNAEGKVDYINYTIDTNNDDFYATNLSQQDQEGNNATKVIMMNLYGSTISDKTPILSVSDVRTFVRKFIDTVLFDDQDNERETIAEVKTAFYAASVALQQSLPDGALFENFAFDDLGRVHNPEYTNPTGVTASADIVFWINDLAETTSTNYDDLTNVLIRSAGGGFEVGDQLVMTGGQMGGTDGVNDLTLTVTGLKNGGVHQLTMTSGGTGFYPHVFPNNIITATGGSGTNCGIHINTCTETGVIVSWEIAYGGGGGYTALDELSIASPGGGDPATFEVTTVQDGGIQSWTISGTAYRGSPETVSNGYWPKMHIDDGEGDQYDDGNWLSTDESVNIVNCDLYDRKMEILSSTITGITLQEGMYCTYKNNDYDTNSFRLVSQSTDNPNVWFIDDQLTESDIMVRIDGIPYNSGDVQTTNNAFGPGSKYVTLYDNSIFAMVVFDANIDSAYYNGEMGADGGGYKEVSTLLGARTVDYSVKIIPQTLVGNNNYYLKPTDAGKHIYYNDGGDNNVWLWAGSSENFPIGTAITIVSGEDGWTFIRSDDSNVKIWGAGLDTISNDFYIPANSMATLLKVAKDKWMLSGAGLGNDD